MAKELSDREGLPKRTSRQINWSKYDTGKPWWLVQGVDFDQSPSGAAHAARQWAYYYGRRVSIKVEPGSITLFIEPK